MWPSTLCKADNNIHLRYYLCIAPTTSLCVFGWSSLAVTPRPILISVHRYDEVAREVLEASKLAVEDPTKQFAISFFDGKSSSLIPLKVTYFLE